MNDLPGQVSAAADVDLRTCYYANHLHRVVAQSGDDGLDHLPDDAVAMLVEWATQLDAMPADIAQAQWSLPARMIVDKIAEKRGFNKAVLRPFVDTFLREVRAYLRTPTSNARTGARNAVAEAIRLHDPHIVIAHSLGTVVAFEALHANPDISVDLFLTVGSPLGMAQVIYHRLQPIQPDDGPGLRPPGVRRWVNVADPGDIIAIPRPFTKRFTPDENHEDVHIHWGDFHTAGRYLASGRVVEAILDHVRRASS